MPKRGKGYRHKVSRPLKGKRLWKSGAFRCVSKKGDFLGFDVLPLPVAVERPFARNAIRVLSLFDGVGSGLVALEKLGMCVEKYYSCEIAEDALQVQRFHFHKKIQSLGNVCHINEERLDLLGRIDLLIAGSTYQDFSPANPGRRGLHGEGSTGSLFFEFQRILMYLQAKSKKNCVHLFWFLENTAALETAEVAEISSCLGCKPVKICSSKFVPMRRERYYWGNIPLIERSNVLPDCSCSLQSFLKPHRSAVVASLPTIATQSEHAKISPVVEEGKESLIYLCELEVLFGFKEHFTDAGNLSVTSRLKLLGNALSIHVLEQLLKPLTFIYANKAGSSGTPKQSISLSY